MNNSIDGEPDELGGWSTAGLTRWIDYKQAKAVAFVEKGYSVEWLPNGDNFMAVYIPQRNDKKEPEIRAETKIFEEPSQFGIDNGRISKLMIQSKYIDVLKKVMGREYENLLLLYNYDRGDDVNRLMPGSESERLFRDVVELLN